MSLATFLIRLYEIDSYVELEVRDYRRNCSQKQTSRSRELRRLARAWRALISMPKTSRERDNTDSIHHSSTPAASNSPSQNVGPRKKFHPCHRCGRHHDVNTCKFRNATCHRCGKTGPVCRTASPPTPGKGFKKHNGKPYFRKRGGAQR